MDHNAYKTQTNRRRRRNWRRVEKGEEEVIGGYRGGRGERKERTGRCNRMKWRNMSARKTRGLRKA